MHLERVLPIGIFLCLQKLHAHVCVYSQYAAGHYLLFLGMELNVQNKLHVPAHLILKAESQCALGYVTSMVTVRTF